jgi:hypothetical protein
MTAAQTLREPMEGGVALRLGARSLEQNRLAYSMFLHSVNVLAIINLEIVVYLIRKFSQLITAILSSYGTDVIAV